MPLRVKLAGFMRNTSGLGVRILFFGSVLCFVPQTAIIGEIDAEPDSRFLELSTVGSQLLRAVLPESHPKM
jgi:hypothetical protein